MCRFMLTVTSLSSVFTVKVKRTNDKYKVVLEKFDLIKIKYYICRG